MSGIIVYGVCNNCYSNDKTYTFNTVTNYTVLVSCFLWFYILVNTEIMHLCMNMLELSLLLYPFTTDTTLYIIPMY